MIPGYLYTLILGFQYTSKGFTIVINNNARKLNTKIQEYLYIRIQG